MDVVDAGNLDHTINYQSVQFNECAFNLQPQRSTNKVSVYKHEPYWTLTATIYALFVGIPIFPVKRKHTYILYAATP